MYIAFDTMAIVTILILLRMSTCFCMVDIISFGCISKLIFQHRGIPLKLRREKYMIKMMHTHDLYSVRYQGVLVRL
jgi:hypothetical protein